MNYTSVNSNEQPPKTNSSHKPYFKVRLGDGKSNSYTKYEADDLSPSDWQELEEQTNNSIKRVYVRIENLPRWPDDARYSLLSFLKRLGTRCRLFIRGEKYDDAFEGVLSAISHGLCVADMQCMQRAAIEAAALFYPDVPEIAAQRINNRLTEVGSAKIHHSNLAKQIRNVAGTTRGSDRVDAQSTASRFLQNLREQADTAEDAPVLRFFQSDFYLWGGIVWNLQAGQQFQARVMRFLQSLELPKLTERFCRDVIAHLQALALLDCWQENMPFEVISEENPLQIRHRSLTVFANGAIDLDEALESDAPPTLLPVGPEYFNEIALPYEFDPEAKCPLWLETLHDILPPPPTSATTKKVRRRKKPTRKGSPKKKTAKKKTAKKKTAKKKASNPAPSSPEPTDRRIEVLQEFFGYTLLLDCRFQKFLVMLGDAGNGKSTITETWEAMLGHENVSSVRLDELGDKFRAYSLKGKVANISGELPYLGRINEAQLKRIVSGEPIDVDRKFQTAIKLRTHAKLIVNTNDLPQVRDPTPATWDRMIVMPFDVRIRGTHNEDENRVEKLKEELPGIFLWALEGLRRLLQNGQFTHCPKCEAATQCHRVESDSVLQFLAECCRERDEYRTRSKLLYGVYRVWAEATGRKPVQEGEFGKRIKRLGWAKRRETIGKRHPYYVGMALTQDGRQYRDQWRMLSRQDVNVCYHAPD